MSFSYAFCSCTLRDVIQGKPHLTLIIGEHVTPLLLSVMKFKQHRPLSRLGGRKNIKFASHIASLFLTLLLSISVLTHRPLRYPNYDVIWSRESLENCVSTKCLLSKQFTKQRLSPEDATTALNQIQAYLEAVPQQPPAPPEGFLESAAFSTCAVVGGAPLPGHISSDVHSRLVDTSTNLTIRLNMRAPEFLVAEDAPAPLGSRTDLVLVQRGSLRSFGRYIYGWGEGNKTRGQQRRLAGEKFKNESNPLIFFRPECPSRFQSCPKAWETLRESALPSWMDVHLLHYDMELRTNRLLKKACRRGRFRIGYDVPSTGIVAVVAALQLCKRVHVFGFNGSVVGDGDLPDSTVWKGHNLRAERILLRQLEVCRKGRFDPMCGKLKIFS